MGKNNLEIDKQGYKKLLWIAINAIGLSISLLMINSYKDNINNISTNSLIYISVTYLFESAKFAGLQYIYLHLFSKTVSGFRWFFSTFIATFILFYFQGFLLMIFIYIAENLSNRISPNSFTSFFGGIEIIYREFSFGKVLFICIIGMTIGLINGIILGKFQAQNIKNPVISNTWKKSASISFGIAYLINSLILTITNLGGIKILSESHYSYNILSFIFGIIYGFATRNSEIIVGNNKQMK